MSRLLWLSLAALAGAASASDPAPPVSASPAGGPPVPDSLPIRFEHAHGTASARWYPTSPGTRQRKRRKAQRQRGAR